MSSRLDRYVRDTSGVWKMRGHSDLSATALAAHALVLDEQFTGGALNASRWSVYDNSNFGSPTRVQLYRAGNVIVGPGSAGATGGTSLKLRAKREAVTYNAVDYAFTAGMLDSKSVGTYYPRYGRFETRCKVPHGQGIWPAFWITAKNGGANNSELDIVEYFHSQTPAKNSTSLHAIDDGTGTLKTNKFTNNGNAANGLWPRTFFEVPTYTPGWHTWTQDIRPVTDAAGATYADPTAPSPYVKFTTYLDGVKVFEFVDSTALTWTSNGGDVDSFWQIYVQGSQIDGKFVGSPDDPLGYSHQLGACLIGGTAPNACTITAGGYSVQSAVFGDPSSTFELDYVRVWKYTG